MEKYLIAKEKNVKTSFWFCFGLFSLSENAASTSKKLSLHKSLCFQTNAIITKQQRFTLIRTKQKKEQYYEKIDFKCFDSSDDILVC